MYEMAYISDTTAEVDKTVKQEEIDEFNAQFAGYADREEGIQPQVFADLYNLIEDWNKRNPYDKVIIEYVSGNFRLKGRYYPTISAVNGRLLEHYLNNTPNLTMEQFLSEYFVNASGKNEIEKYYFNFKAEEFEYDQDGRINKIKMYMLVRS